MTESKINDGKIDIGIVIEFDGNEIEFNMRVEPDMQLDLLHEAALDKVKELLENSKITVTYKLGESSSRVS